MTRKVQHKQRKRANKGRYKHSINYAYSVPVTRIAFLSVWQHGWQSLYDQRVIVEED